MKCKALFILLFLPICSLAQNLVPNPSFEEYEECPNSHSQFEGYVLDWTSWQGTPDYFNSCNNELSGDVGVPNNIYGFQTPITGISYAGIFTSTHSALNGREYIAVPLLESMEIGESYYVSFYASLFDGTNEPEVWCASNNLGLSFFRNPDYNSQTNPLVPNNISQIHISDILIDTSNWTRIEGVFIADDAYNWLCIGNFYDDNNTDTIQFNNQGYCFSTYYIENVCVAKTQGECDYLINVNNELESQPLKVYPNPASTIISIQSSLNKDIQEVRLTDVTGKTVETVTFQNMSTININVESYAKGIYFIQVKSNHHFFNYKIIIQ